MNIEQYRDYCLNKKEVTEHFPFDNDTLVFKVLGKMFALASLKRWENGEAFINLKCDPERSIELRDEYDGLIYGGYHMNKKLWNTLEITNLPHKLIFELIDHSYDLVVAKMSKKMRDQFKLLD